MKWLSTGYFISTLLALQLFLFSCAPVKFNKSENANADVIVNPLNTTISCSPRVNGESTNVTLTSTSPNPLISANCIPSDVNYTWTATREGTQVSIPGLEGANSNPAISQLGVGTYEIRLEATQSGYDTYKSANPLVIVVSANQTNNMINCSPRLNNNQVSVSIPLSGPNPSVMANCTPSSVALQWRVQRGSEVVSLPSLTGASSTPLFTSLGVGTYSVYLTATASGYNTYTLVSPLTVMVSNNPTNTRDVTYTKLVTAENNKIDFLVVFDDSKSMLPDNLKLAGKLQGFLNDLKSSGIDWQMCATVTRAREVSGQQVWGTSKTWVGNPDTSLSWVLKSTVTNLNQIFSNTVTEIGAGHAGTDDERAIKAAWNHIDLKQYNSCYRSGAALAVIILSDEDERSVGGDQRQIYYLNEYKELEAQDQPQEFVNKVKLSFGNDKRLTVNSIIVKPGDTACKQSQDSQVTSEGAAISHYGVKYDELSRLTSGASTSICAADFSENLYYFKDKIINSLSSVPLECAPVGGVQVEITPTMGGSLTSQIQNNTLVFSTPIPAGRTIKLTYKCAM